MELLILEIKESVYMESVKKQYESPLIELIDIEIGPVLLDVSGEDNEDIGGDGPGYNDDDFE